jgi:hypothetical protein
MTIMVRPNDDDFCALLGCLLLENIFRSPCIAVVVAFVAESILLHGMNVFGIIFVLMDVLYQKNKEHGKRIYQPSEILIMLTLFCTFKFQTIHYKVLIY